MPIRTIETSRQCFENIHIDTGCSQMLYKIFSGRVKKLVSIQTFFLLISTGIFLNLML